MSQQDTLPQLIILVGPMGAGKTTVGRRVAAAFGYDFFDVDEELEKNTGVSVNLIFEIEKEAGFRLRETQMLTKLLKGQRAVIATGGGIIVTEANRELLKQSDAMVVYLQTEVREQLRRLKRDKQRPLLRGRGRRGRLKNMAKIRNPLYEEVSDLTLVSGYHPPQSMAEEVVAAIQDVAKLMHLKEPAHP